MGQGSNLGEITSTRKEKPHAHWESGLKCKIWGKATCISGPRSHTHVELSSEHESGLTFPCHPGLHRLCSEPVSRPNPGQVALLPESQTPSASLLWLFTVRRLHSCRFLSKVPPLDPTPQAPNQQG